MGITTVSVKKSKIYLHMLWSKVLKLFKKLKSQASEDSSEFKKIHRFPFYVAPLLLQILLSNTV